MPERKRSLVSIGMLAEAGQTTLIEFSWRISWGNMKTGSEYKYNNLYPLMANNLEGTMNIVESPDLNLWHGRIDHMFQAVMDRLMSVGYILKLQLKMNFYQDCRYEKQTRSPHSLHYETIGQPLELVHIDICGSMLERSLGGSRYFITFVDDCT